MRKILLTTTALVALGGVSAASAMNISGSYGFEYTNSTNTGGSADAAKVSGDDFSSDGLITFSDSTTTDAGLTFGGRMTLNAAGAIEDQQLDIAGDFGYIMMGAQDGVVDGMDGFMQGAALVENGATTTNANAVNLNTSPMVADNPGTEKIGFRTNVISGFQAAVSYEDAGTTATQNNDVTAWIVTYDFGVAKIGYASSNTVASGDDGSNQTNTHYGIGTTLAGLTVGLGFGAEKLAGANGAVDQRKVDTRDVGLSYALDGGIGLYAQIVSSEDKTGANAGDKLSATTFGLSYAVAPGVSALVETASADYTDATVGSANSDGRTASAAKLTVSF